LAICLATVRRPPGPPKHDTFEPSLASTQIDEDDRDEFEEVLMAEKPIMRMLAN
jgi:hypothetical protein